MSETGNKHSEAPLEENIITTQQKPLIDPKGMAQPPQPPTYEQATGEHKPVVTPVAAAGPTVVVVHESVTLYGPQPIDVQCPYCHNFCRTRLRYKANSRTHLIALLLCLFQLYCCICLPYCIKSCMDANHYCGICDRYLGTYKR